MADEATTFMVEDARLIFKNFEGKEGPYNRKGDRNFGLVLTPELAEQLLADGWNVKYLEAREEGEEPTPWLPVSVNFKNRPPRVVLLSNNGKTRTHLNEDTVETVDMIDIQNVDLIVRAYEWSVNDKSGIKAYLQSMFITIREDALERKYAINANPGGDND